MTDGHPGPEPGPERETGRVLVIEDHAETPSDDSGMLRIARRAGRLGASPRDALEIHTAVLKEKEGEEGPQRVRLFMAEGRLRLLELMGHLVTYCRDPED